MGAFANALREARTAAGLTQAQLGSLLWPGSAARGAYALSCPFIVNLESGRKTAGLELAGRIARVLKLPSWHFTQAIVSDMLDAQCRAHEVTTVIVGLRAYAQRCTAEEWAAIRGVKVA